jgi:hypothetical protein
MKIFFRIVSISVGPAFTLLHAPFTTDADFSAAILFHLFQAVTARTYEQSEKVDLGEFLDGNIDLVLRTEGSLLLVILYGRSEVRINSECLFNKANALFFEFFLVAYFTCVGPATVAVISRWG